MDWLTLVLAVVVALMVYRWMGGMVIVWLVANTPMIVWDRRDYQIHVWLWPLVLVRMLTGGGRLPPPD